MRHFQPLVNLDIQGKHGKIWKVESFQPIMTVMTLYLWTEVDGDPELLSEIDWLFGVLLLFCCL